MLHDRLADACPEGLESYKNRHSHAEAGASRTPTWARRIDSGCTALFFHPDHALVGTPQRHGIEYWTEEFRAADGVRLSAWFLPARITGGGGAKGTVLFLHGNAENVSTHFRSVA
jgi:hypothetical protein